MKYQVTLHNGQGFNIKVESEKFAELLLQELNSKENNFVLLGGCVVYKSSISTVLPIVEAE